MNESVRLLREAQEGDRVALDRLIARHRARLLAFVSARLRAAGPNLAQADDIVQETTLEAARKVAAFEPQGPASFYRWLVGIARFKLLEAARSGRARKRAMAVPLAHDPLAVQTSPSGGAVRAERADRVAAAIDSLPDAQREAVRMRYLAGMPVAECAQQMDRSEAAVKALVSRGLAELAGRLREVS